MKFSSGHNKLISIHLYNGVFLMIYVPENNYLKITTKGLMFGQWKPYHSPYMMDLEIGLGYELLDQSQK